MKKIYAIVLSFMPLIGFGQFTVEWHSADFKTGYQYEDFGFDYTLTNENTDNPIDITWKFTHELSNSSTTWEDYMCEGIFVCWPATKRSNTFTLNAGESVDMYHHILTFSDGDSGTWVSTAYIWQEGDSANTVQEFVVTAKTGLKVDINGKTVYIMDGDSFELWGSEMVPLSIEDRFSAFPNGETVLSQNAPNPFKGTTTIQYRITGESGSIKFHDLTGKMVKEIQLSNRAGQLTLQGELDAGIYFYSLWEDGQMVESRRMQVIE